MQYFDHFIILSQNFENNAKPMHKYVQNIEYRISKVFFFFWKMKSGKNSEKTFRDFEFSEFRPVHSVNLVLECQLINFYKHWNYRHIRKLAIRTQKTGKIWQLSNLSLSLINRMGKFQAFIIKMSNIWSLICWNSVHISAYCCSAMSIECETWES